MSNFRFKLLGLAALATLFAGVSFGQVTACVANTAAQGGSTDPGPNTLRSEGTTELVGDLQFNCTSAAASQTGLVEVFTTTTVTSKANALYTGYTEAVLFVCTTAVAPCVSPASPAVGLLSTGAVNNPTVVNAQTTVADPIQAYYGVATGSSLTFSNVALPAGGFFMRVGNVRINASGVTLTSTLTSVTEQVLVSGGGTSSSLSSAVTVGYVLQSLQVTTLQPTPEGGTTPTVINYATCQGDALPTTFNPNPVSLKPSFLVEVKSLFAGAFKKVNGVGGEGGSFVPADGSGAGVATQPTQIQVVFGGVPTGVTLYLPTTVSVGNLTLTAVTSAGTAVAASTLTNAPPALTAANYFLSFPYAAVSPLISTGATAAFTPTGGSITVIYQVTATDTTTASFAPDIPVWVIFANNTFTTAQGPITVLEGYNPQAAFAAATSIPNFAVQTATPVNATVIALCQTDLLFPYLTNTSGFDVGIALANTSLDPFGTTPSPGACTLNFYGTGAPTPATGVAAPGGSQAGGATTAFLLSSVAPGFTGYMIAVCQYQYGHGFAYIIDGFGQPSGTTMGYLAEVIGVSGRPNASLPAEINTF
jgi:hypothetical protein